MKKGNKLSLTQKAMQALNEAVDKVVEDHRRRAKPLAVWRNGKAVWISVEDAETVREKLTRSRFKNHGPKS